VQAAVFGPAAAGVAWLALYRWRWARRAVAGLAVLGSLAAAWWVFWLAYLGEGPAWRGLTPDLLGATAAAVAEVGIAFGVFGLERRPVGERPLVVVGLAASAVAVVLAAYTDSLILLGVALPIPTLAVGAVALAGGRFDARGLGGLALADAVALVGLSVVLDRAGTTVIGSSTGLGVALLLAGAAGKAGAVPGIGTARLVATGGPGAPLAGALRGQAVVLAAIAGLTMASAEEAAPLAIVASVVALGAGVVAVLAVTEGGVLAGVIAAAGAILFLAVGLGGGVGARAFLLLFPGFLVAAAAGQVLWPGSDLPRLAPVEGRGRRLLLTTAILSGGVVLGSLVGIPPGGGFPGTWLVTSLAASRMGEGAWYLLVEAGALLGLALALIASVGLLRSVRPRAAALAAAAAALSLLYVGSQPVRLGVGWWLRIETALGIPTVLPSGGGPGVPPVSGRALLLALGPALLLAVAVVGLGRGVRRTTPGFVPLRQPRPGRPPARAKQAEARRPPEETAVEAPTAEGQSPPEGEPPEGLPPESAVAGPRPSLRRRLAGALRPRPFPRTALVVAAIMELAAIAMAVRLVVVGVQAGFL
jgi:hypothetical protein